MHRFKRRSCVMVVITALLICVAVLFIYNRITGQELLATAAQRHSPLLAKSLLLFGAPVNNYTSDGLTPLMVATAYGDKDLSLIKVFITHGADVNLQDKQHDCTALHIAALYNNINAVTLLINNNADLNIQDCKGRTPLLIAVLKGHHDIVEILLKNGANPNIADATSRLPLAVAVKQALRKQNVHSMELLLDYKADANKYRDDGFALLHLAACANNVKVAELLLAHGADVNKKGGTMGMTPLHLAVYYGNKEMTQLLLSRGADQSITTSNGFTAQDIRIKRQK